MLPTAVTRLGLLATFDSPTHIQVTDIHEWMSRNQYKHNNGVQWVFLWFLSPVSIHFCWFRDATLSVSHSQFISICLSFEVFTFMHLSVWLSVPIFQSLCQLFGTLCRECGLQAFPETWTPGLCVEPEQILQSQLLSASDSRSVVDQWVVLNKHIYVSAYIISISLCVYHSVYVCLSVSACHCLSLFVSFCWALLVLLPTFVILPIM